MEFQFDNNNNEKFNRLYFKKFSMEFRNGEKYILEQTLGQNVKGGFNYIFLFEFKKNNKRIEGYFVPFSCNDEQELPDAEEHWRNEIMSEFKSDKIKTVKYVTACRNHTF